MAQNKWFLPSLFLMCLSAISLAQSPAIDPNWSLQTGTSGAVSDEFKGSSVNSSLWNVFDCNNYSCCSCTPTPVCSWGGSEGWNQAYTTETGGNLNFKVDFKI